MPWRPRYSFARLCVDVWVTDNSSTKRCGQYIAYAATRAANGPDGMKARGRPFSKKFAGDLGPASLAK